MKVVHAPVPFVEAGALTGGTWGKWQFPVATANLTNDNIRDAHKQRGTRIETVLSMIETDYLSETVDDLESIQLRVVGQWGMHVLNDAVKCLTGV